jgi:hypothetical protein
LRIVRIFEGGFILAHLRSQLTHLRDYLELLFAIEPTTPSD